VANADVPLTIVMPAFNEEEGIAQAVAEVQRELMRAVPGAELVVVNDGSRDRTGAILDELAARDSSLRLIHQPNEGHGRALRAGLEAARGEYVFLVDSDRQIPLRAFHRLWEAARGRSGAFGLRRVRHDSAIRVALSSLIRATLTVLFGVRLRDANVPFKIIRRSVWIEARKVIPPHALAPSLLLAVFMRRRGMDVIEEEVPHCRRTTGRGSLRHLKLISFCLRAFGQLLVFRRRLGS